MPSLPELTKTWWPVLLAFFTLLGFTTTAVTYYAKAETRNLIQAELMSPLDKVRKEIEQQQNQLHQLQQQNSASQAKIDLMIQMMMKQNQVLDAQSRSIEALPEKVK